MKNEHVNVKLDRTINAAVLTVSDTRTKETDKGGNLAKELLSEINVEITDDHYTIVKDDKQAITEQVQQWLNEDVDVIITTGGTGIAQRDVTIEAVTPLLTK